MYVCMYVCMYVPSTINIAHMVIVVIIIIFHQIITLGLKFIYVYTGEKKISRGGEEYILFK
jgi:hypothetical protein